MSPNAKGDVVKIPVLAMAAAVLVAQPALAQSILASQGLLVNGDSGGVPVSILRTDFNYTLLGFRTGGDIRLAEDFVVPAGELWTVQAITLFAFEAGATSASIDEFTLQIRNAAPPGGAILFGDTTTNIVPTATMSGIFRVKSEAPTDRSRQIQALRVPLSRAVTLLPGTYYFDFNASDTTFFPPIVDPNDVGPFAPNPTGNALLYDWTSASWVPANMQTVFGNGGPQQGLPFIIEGSATGPEGVPSLNVVSLLAMALGLIAAAWAAIRR